MRRVRSWILIGSVISMLPLAACQQATVAEPESGPAHVEPIGDSGLSRVTLTSKAAVRIGIKTTSVNKGIARRTLPASGEVVAVAGAPGAVEVKVSLNASDFVRVDHAQVARVLPNADGETGALTAHIGREEQTAGYGDGTVYYLPDSKDHGLKPGQRPRLALPLKGSGSVRLSVPYQAILYDSTGAAWVYTNPEALVFVRAPVKIDYVDGQVAVLAEGPSAGTSVVTVGVSELYGTEVGVGE